MEHVLWAVAVIGIVGIVALRSRLCHLRSGKDQVAAAGDAANGLGLDRARRPAARTLRGDVPGHAGRALLPRETVAIAAAQQGARAAGAEQGRESDGVGAANDFLAEAGGDDVLTATSASANRTATTATVTVSGFA